MPDVLAKSDAGPVARPLRVLVPLIKEDLRLGKEAEEAAGMPYYQAAGEKLIEAKAQIAHGDFKPWIERNFALSYSTAARYTAYAVAPSHLKSAASGTFRTLSEVTEPNRDPGHHPPWHEPVRQIVSRVDAETLNLRREELKRQEERDAQRKPTDAPSSESVPAESTWALRSRRPDTTRHPGTILRLSLSWVGSSKLVEGQRREL